MAKTRSQEDDPVPQWFLRFEEANDQRISRMEAMVADWRVSMKQKEQRSNQRSDDQSTLDRSSTPSMKTDLEEKSTSQFQVPIANSEIVRSIEPGKVDLELEKLEHVVMNKNLEQEWDQMNVNEKLEVDCDVERGQKMISDTETSCAHKVLVKMPSKEKHIKHLKGWKFKFKRKSLVGIMLQVEQNKLSKRRRRMYSRLSTNIKDESMKVMIPGNHLRMLRQLHKPRVQCKMRMMNDSWSMRQPTLKIMKSHRKHKWKSKHLQIASNFWINHSHKLADLVLRTALTDWKTKNSKGLAYDGCVSLEINFAGFGRGKTEMLATSQKMQKMNLLSFGIHTEMEEDLKQQQGDIEPLLTVPDLDAKPTLRISMRDIQKRLDQYMVLLLTPVAYATHFSGGVGMDKKQSCLSLRANRVWDPGGSNSEND